RGTAARRLREAVEGTLRLHQFVAALQPFVDAVALAAVVGDDAVHVVVPGGDAGMLDDARGADEGELLELDHLLDKAARAVGEAEAPAGRSEERRVGKE